MAMPRKQSKDHGGVEKILHGGIKCKNIHMKSG